MTSRHEPAGTPAPLKQKLAQITKRIEEKQKQTVKELADQGYTEERVAEFEAELATPSGSRQTYRGKASSSVIAEVQMELFRGEQQGRFTKMPIEASTEFPTLLTRLPVFVPGRRTNQRDLIDQENAMQFETSWAKGKKHGPPLTIYDEDTLLALGKLRQDNLRGHGSRLPISVQDPMGRGAECNVHVLFTTLAEIQAQFGTKKSGKAYEMRLDSIRRLASTRLDLAHASGTDTGPGTIFSLLDVAWDRWENDKILYIQFSPVLTHWFENTFTYINWNVRMALKSDVGKAVHRFLSGQGTQYTIGAEKLRRIVLFQDEMKYFLKKLRESLRTMEDLGWLKHWEIEGTGRQIPYKLHIFR